MCVPNKEDFIQMSESWLLIGIFWLQLTSWHRKQLNKCDCYTFCFCPAFFLLLSSASLMLEVSLMGQQNKKETKTDNKTWNGRAARRTSGCFDSLLTAGTVVAAACHSQTLSWGTFMCVSLLRFSPSSNWLLFFSLFISQNPLFSPAFPFKF